MQIVRKNFFKFFLGKSESIQLLFFIKEHLKNMSYEQIEFYCNFMSASRGANSIIAKR